MECFAGTPAAVAVHQVACPAKANSCEPAEHAATAIINAQDNTDAADAGQEAHLERAQSDAQKSFESAPSDRPLLPEAWDLASGQHISKAGAQSAAQGRRHLCSFPVKAAGNQSSVHAGSNQPAQHSRALSEYDNPEEVAHPHPEGITGIPRPAGIVHAGTAAELHHQSPALVCSSSKGADQSSGIASQRAAAGSLTEQPDAVVHLVAVPLIHGSSGSACQRGPCGPGTQPEAQVASVADMANYSSRQDPQSYEGGPQDTACNSSKQGLQSSTGGPSNVAGNSSKKDPRGSTELTQNGSEAAHSPSAVRPCSERRSSSSSPAEDAPECSPADDEPVLMENQVIVPPGKRHSQSTGSSIDVKGSGFSRSQDLASVEKTKVGHSAEQAAEATMASGVEAANKENDVSSASLAAPDSQAGAVAVMEEEQAKAAAAAAAQVVPACLSARCQSCVQGSHTSRQLHCLDGSRLRSRCQTLLPDMLGIPLVLI